MAHSTALSMLTSSNTMRQLLPPSSMQVGTPLFAASAMMRRPVTVLPVKLILAMPGLELHMQSRFMICSSTQLRRDLTGLEACATNMTMEQIFCALMVVAMHQAAQRKVAACKAVSVGVCCQICGIWTPHVQLRRSLRERAACIGAQAGDQVEHAWRQAHLIDDGCQLQACHRCHLRWLQHNRAALQGDPM